MTAVRKPGRPRDEAIDDAILSATIDELIERGYIAMSVESIAARAGVAKTTVYRRYPTQDELVLAAMRSIVEADTEPPPGSARDDVLFLVESMRRSWANARFAALMRRSSADGTQRPEQYRQVRDKMIAPKMQRMQQALERCVGEGLIRPGVDLVWVRQMITSPIMAASLTHKDRVTRAQIEFALDTVLAGLAP